MWLDTPWVSVIMKTPERWRALPRRPSCQYSCPIDLLTQTFHTLQQLIMTDRQKLSSLLWRYVMTSRCDVMWRHDVRLWRHMMPYNMTKWNCEPSQPTWKSENNVFQPSDLDIWPMTLTFELIRDIVKVNPSTKFWVCTSNGSARRVLTDKHTHRCTGPILYPRPLTREGKIPNWLCFSTRQF